MKNFLSKLNFKGLYCCIGNSKVDYHAGSFFIYKKVSYLRFFPNAKVAYFERIEGQRPDDTDYQKVYALMNSSNEIIQITEVKEVGWNNNLAQINLKRQEKQYDFYCLPSILIENVSGKEITEVILDSINEAVKITEVYSLILID